MGCDATPDTEGLELEDGYDTSGQSKSAERLSVRGTQEEIHDHGWNPGSHILHPPTQETTPACRNALRRAGTALALEECVTGDANSGSDGSVMLRLSPWLYG